MSRERRGASWTLFHFHVPVVLTSSGLTPVLALAMLFGLLARGSSTTTMVTATVMGGVGGVISLLVHEFGHVLAAERAPGVRAVRIALIWGGAATHLEGSYQSPQQQIRVASAGPLASLALAAALVPIVALPVIPPLRFAACALMLLNVVIAGASLIPIQPLDGHKIVVATAWAIAGTEERGRLLVARIGVLCVAVDIGGAACLILREPLLGALTATVAAVLFVQKHLVARLPVTPAARR